MSGVIAIGLSGFLLIGLLILLLNTRSRYNEIDKEYGKPYLVKLVKLIGTHPELKQGSMAISLHPKNVIAFNRKAFLFSQISSIRIISELPEKFESDRKSAANFREEEKYICITLTDEYGKNEVIFTTKSDFNEVAEILIQKWKKYLIFN